VILHRSFLVRSGTVEGCIEIQLCAIQRIAGQEVMSDRSRERHILSYTLRLEVEIRAVVCEGWIGESETPSGHRMQRRVMEDACVSRLRSVCHSGIALGAVNLIIPRWSTRLPGQSPGLGCRQRRERRPPGARV
jgi:hypothetical protein